MPLPANFSKRRGGNGKFLGKSRERYRIHRNLIIEPTLFIKQRQTGAVMLVYVFPISQTGSSRFGGTVAQQRVFLGTLAYKKPWLFPCQSRDLQRRFL